MNDIKKVFMVGNIDKSEYFWEEEKFLKRKGFLPQNPLRLRQDYESRFGELSTKDLNKKLINSLLHSDAIILLPDWEKSSLAKLQKEIATACGKSIIKILL